MRTADKARRTYADQLTAQFRAEVDPDGTIAATDPAELDRLVAARRSIHFRALALKSTEIRQANAQANAQARKQAALDAARANLDAELAALTGGAA